MKIKERKEAIKLRKKGESIRSIAKKLNVSRGSVSRWVEEIVLTQRQIERLKNNQIRSYVILKDPKFIELNKERARDKRREYQNKGRNLLKRSNKMFIAGIMLFWAEGTKRKNAVIFSNSEPVMMKFFIDFLRKFFKFDENRLKFSFQWYSNNSLTKNKVSNYWSNLLGIDKNQMNKCYIDYRPVKNMGKKKGKCPYGICRLILNETRIAQMLYGAIQEYIGFEDERWLF